MDMEKFEKMAEMMKGCCEDGGGFWNCCSMMKKMMQPVEGEKKGKQEKDAADKE